MDTIKINVQQYIVECTLRKVENPNGDIILLTGATTFSDTYFLFAAQFKHYNLIIINTPGHGETTGDAITVANYYLEFYESTIRELISKGYCGPIVNLVGYSLGGLTLYHLIMRQHLNSYIDKSILLFAAYKADPKAIRKSLNQYKIANSKHSMRALLHSKSKTVSPLLYKLAPNRLVFTSNKSSLNDFILVEALNKLSANQNYGPCVCDVLLLSAYDKFFLAGDILMTREILNATFINPGKASHYAPLNTPKKYVRLIENFLLDNL